MRIYYVLALLTLLIVISCNVPASKQSNQAAEDSSKVKTHTRQFKALQYIDAFIEANNPEIKKSNALKEHYEGLCTKQILPKIDKYGLYNDLPFELITTALNDGVAYGNFIYDDEKHFVKVSCIIPKKLLMELKENGKYLITFKVVKFEDGVSFNNEFSRIELPTVDARLKSFTAYNEQ